MGFPKPWPTDWPESPSPDGPQDDSLGAPDYSFPGMPDNGPDSIPEFRRRFCSVTWAVNHLCNLRCTHCYDVVAYQRSDLSTSQGLTLIDRLADAGVTFIAFSGGEAFLRKDLFQLMTHCKQRGMQFGARSNGTRITNGVAHQLKELSISVVGVSFDGATQRTHDAVRGIGAFSAALSGFRALIAEGIRAQMEVVLSKQNAKEALKFIQLGESLGAAEVNFSALTPQGRGATLASDLLDHSTWLQLSKVLKEASARAVMPVTPNCALLGPCFANIEPHINCDGWMAPCYLSAAKLFNVLETPANLIREYLHRDRVKYQDVCGRRRWTQEFETSPSQSNLVKLTREGWKSAIAPSA